MQTKTEEIKRDIDGNIFDYEAFKEYCKNSIYLKTVFNECFKSIKNGRLEYFNDFLRILNEDEMYEEFDFFVYGKERLNYWKENIEKYIDFLNKEFPKWNEIKFEIKGDSINNNLDRFLELPFVFWSGGTICKKEFYFNKKEIISCLKEAKRFEHLEDKDIDCNDLGNVWIAQGIKEMVSICKEYVAYKEYFFNNH